MLPTNLEDDFPSSEIEKINGKSPDVYRMKNESLLKSVLSFEGFIR